MLTADEFKGWDCIDKEKEIRDLYTLYLWSADYTPWKELIPRLKTESTSESSLYDIARYIVALSKEIGE